MSGFGCERQASVAIPKQHSFSQAGSCGYNNLSSLRRRDSRMDSLDVLRIENLDALRRRFQVTQESHKTKAEMFRHQGAVDNPRQVRTTHSMVHHRAGHTE